VAYYPYMMDKFAIAFLFMPSIIFWGSAILKDTFTFSATCWFVHALDELYFKRRNLLGNILAIVICSTIIIIIKPYIFMVLFPVSLLWIFHSRMSRIKSVLVKFIVLPIGAIMVVVFTVYALQKLEDSLDKFSMDKALKTIEVAQDDLTRADAYGSNYFEIGELDGTWASVLSKFPIAVNAALFRPYLWESRTVVIAISGLENLWILFLTVFTITKVGLFLPRAMFGESRLMFCLLFALSFAFVVGVTTPNFGALVRFKIPMIPFFISAMYLLRFLADRKRATERNNLRFSLAPYKNGDPLRGNAAAEVGKKAGYRKRSFTP